MNHAMSIIYMADVIGSRDALTPERYGQFKDVVAGINRAFADRLGSPLTVTLGDEFQGVIAARDRTDSITTALEMVFKVEEELVLRHKGIALRHVIHEGIIDTALNPESAHGMIGEGLSTAREELAQLKKGRGMSKRFSVHLNGEHPLSQQLNRCFLLYESITDSWKPRDAELIGQFLAHGDYKKVAEELGKDTSLMWRRQNSLWMREYDELKNLMRDMVFMVDLEHDADTPESIPDIVRGH